MAFTSISSTLINVGKAVKREIFTLIKDNFDDHESRLGNLEVGAAKIKVFDGVVKPASSFAHIGVAYYVAKGPFLINETFIQLFTKESLGGTLEIDILKSTTDTNDSSFTSIFSTKPSLVFASVSDYAVSTNQVLNINAQVQEGDILRFDITQMPSGGTLTRFLISIAGE